MAGRIKQEDIEAVRERTDIVKLVEFEGEEWLFYKAAPVTVAFIRGTTADPDGNIIQALYEPAISKLTWRSE